MAASRFGRKGWMTIMALALVARTGTRLPRTPERLMCARTHNPGITQLLPSKALNATQGAGVAQAATSTRGTFSWVHIGTNAQRP